MSFALSIRAQCITTVFKGSKLESYHEMLNNYKTLRRKMVKNYYRRVLFIIIHCTFNPQRMIPNKRRTPQSRLAYIHLFHNVSPGLLIKVHV